MATATSTPSTPRTAGSGRTVPGDDVGRVTDRQPEIAAALGVDATSDPAVEVTRRVGFLVDYLRTSGARGYVLGISGGVDSLVAGWMAQQACRQAGARFVAVRLPYGVQADEADAQASVAFIGADEVVTVDIAAGVDGLHAAATPDGGYATAAEADFVKGNIKARARMAAQYALAGTRDALVVGTDQAPEALMGFFTKHGDGACDVAPLSGLTKGQVRAIARLAGAPVRLVEKTPTADLEDERPGLPDEEVYGVTYADLDDYLACRPVTDRVRATVESAYAATMHKRQLPATPTR